MAFDGQSHGFATYQSHRKVKAAKINRVYSETCVGVEPDGRSITFNPANKPKPQVGWYVLCYDDGYLSFSPPASFESGYSKVDD